MPARRCSLCGISYPVTYAYKCPIHDEPTAYFPNVEADEDWAEQALRLKRDLEISQWVEGTETYIPDIPGKVTLRDGRYFIDSRNVIRADIGHRLRDTDLVRVGAQVFEILGYVYAARAYLVRPFSMTLSDEDIRLLNGE